MSNNKEEDTINEEQLERMEIVEDEIFSMLKDLNDIDLLKEFIRE